MSVPDQRITLGYRLQDSVLPAITFEVTAVEKVAFDSVKSCEVELRAIAETTEAALDIASELEGAVRTGTWLSIQINSRAVAERARRTTITRRGRRIATS